MSRTINKIKTNSIKARRVKKSIYKQKRNLHTSAAVHSANENTHLTTIKPARVGKNNSLIRIVKLSNKKLKSLGKREMRENGEKRGPVKGRLAIMGSVGGGEDVEMSVDRVLGEGTTIGAPDME